MKSTRFPVAVHILTILYIAGDDYVSSELLAKSIDTNPAVIRKILQTLIGEGWVESHAGVHGGARLAVDPKTITLLDVFELVEKPGVFKMHEPQMKCPVACVLKDEMSEVFEKSEAAMERILKQTNIAQLGSKAKRRWDKINSPTA